MRLRLDRKKEWPRHTFEVTAGIAVIEETTWSQPNTHAVTRKQAGPAIMKSQPEKGTVTKNQWLTTEMRARHRFEVATHNVVASKTVR